MHIVGDVWGKPWVLAMTMTGVRAPQTTAVKVMTWEALHFRCGWQWPLDVKLVLVGPLCLFPLVTWPHEGNGDDEDDDNDDRADRKGNDDGDIVGAEDVLAGPWVGYGTVDLGEETESIGFYIVVTKNWWSRGTCANPFHEPMLIRYTDVYICHQSSLSFNSLRLSVAIWRHCLRQWLVAYSAPSHYLNQCWLIFKWTFRSTFQWNFIQNSNNFNQQNVFENVASKMASILFTPHWLSKPGIMNSREAVLHIVLYNTPLFLLNTSLQQVSWPFTAAIQVIICCYRGHCLIDTFNRYESMSTQWWKLLRETWVAMVLINCHPTIKY